MEPSKDLDEQIDELRHAVREGLSNHTGEFANPWIFKKNYSHEELADILEDIMASKRLFDNLQRLILADRKKHELQARIEELDNLPRYDNPKYGISNKVQVSKEWMRKRKAELKQELESYE